ncbi:unnamed protein product, partial [Notodromas monacha]
NLRDVQRGHSVRSPTSPQSEEPPFRSNLSGGAPTKQRDPPENLVEAPAPAVNVWVKRIEQRQATEPPTKQVPGPSEDHHHQQQPPRHHQTASSPPPPPAAAKKVETQPTARKVEEPAAAAASAAPPPPSPAPATSAWGTRKAWATVADPVTSSSIPTVSAAANGAMGDGGGGGSGSRRSSSQKAAPTPARLGFGRGKASGENVPPGGGNGGGGGGGTPEVGVMMPSAVPMGAWATHRLSSKKDDVTVMTNKFAGLSTESDDSISH